MLRFIKNGPEIPERLLQAHEDGNVVFFCGAGISIPADLPGFASLTRSLFDAEGLIPSPIEERAIKHCQYDQAIALLEDKVQGKRAAVRKHLHALLTPTNTQAMPTHKAILTLAHDKNGCCRLVTTNFDRLFEQAAADLKLQLSSCCAPTLPVPKHKWTGGLVYLHGLLPESDTADLNDLVLSSGDFGLAYLTERWASRFVGELFRNFTVVFVGYSVGDPVLRYMMDALAADRLMGETSPAPFAFTDFPRGKQSETIDEWKAKHVTPILYKRYKRHHYLHKTLGEWASAYRDGISGKERTIEQFGSLPPPKISTDYVTNRLIWAITDPSGVPAKRFSQLDPVSPLEWLTTFSKHEFDKDDLPRFSIRPDPGDEKCSFTLLDRPAQHSKAPNMRLLHNGNKECAWDRVMAFLGKWLTRHVQDPALILWIAQHGSTLHHQWQWQIEDEIEKHPPRPELLRLWRLVLNGYLEKPTHLDLYTWKKQFLSEGLTVELRMRFRSLLSPRVRVNPPLIAWEDAFPDQETLRGRLNWEVVLATAGAHATLKSLRRTQEWDAALPSLLSDSTSMLQDVCELMQYLGDADEEFDWSYLQRPSIADHPQNNTYREWTALIDLARDSFNATVNTKPDSARHEAEQWAQIPIPLFKRLAFYAATTTGLISPSEALDWLLDNDAWWLWALSTTHETLLLMTKIADELEQRDRELLETAFITGPPRRMYRDDISDEDFNRSADRQVWIRLTMINTSGAQLGTREQERLAQIAQRYPRWKLSDDDRDSFPSWIDDDSEPSYQQTPVKTQSLVSWLQSNPSSDPWYEDDWQDRCATDFKRCAIALLHLASHNGWVVDRWSQALSAWGQEPLHQQSWRCIGRFLAENTATIPRNLTGALAHWLKSISTTEGIDGVRFFKLLNLIIEYSDDESDGAQDPLFRAINHPVGHAVQACLNWWYRQGPENDEGLPLELQALFATICTPTEGRYRYGRVILCAHIIPLFQVDPSWTQQHVIPLLDWNKSKEEATAAWAGYLWAPRIYRPLMDEMKASFLATAHQYDALDEHKQQYANLLTVAALEPGDTFRTAELATATSALPNQGLETTAWTLTRMLDSAGDRREAYWKNRIVKYLKRIWPRVQKHGTEQIAEAFATLCSYAGNAFPDAVVLLQDWFLSLRHPGTILHILNESDHPEAHPDATLALLDRLIDLERSLVSLDFGSIMHRLETSDPSLTRDERFKRLSAIVQLQSELK